MTSMNMSFPALRGRQGTRDYYVATFPLKVIPRLFTFGERGALDPEARAQRTLSSKRVPEIVRYLLEHPEDWVFASLTASFDAEEVFRPSKLDPNMGIFEVPLGTDFFINDGQHRRAAIERAIEENEGLADQTVSVLLFREENVERSQQMFSDLNRTVQKTPRSLDILYDHRDPMNRIVQGVANAVPLFEGRIEKERISLPERSPRFVTLSALYDANAQLLGDLREGEIDEDKVKAAEDLAILFWEALTENVPQWRAIRDGDLEPAEARARFVHSHAVGFWALAAAGGDLIGEYPDEVDWKARLGRLVEVDWRKENPDWQGICMLGADIITRRQTREATAKYLRWHLGLIPEKPGRVLERSA